MSKNSISVGQYFECPDCQHDVIEEVQDDIVLSSEITDIHVGENEAEYGAVNWYGGCVNRYQCKNCGYTIKNEYGAITDLEELYEWLVTHKKKD